MDLNDPVPPGNHDVSMDVDHFAGPVMDIHPLALIVNLPEGSPESPTNSEDPDRLAEMTVEILESEPDSSSTSREPSPQPKEEEQEFAGSPPSKKRSLNDSEAYEDDGALCPICLDNWTTTGEHRICSLKCGHLFGFSCVTRWLNVQNRRTCPTCKKHVINGDVRFIYAKKLLAVDNAELESIKRQLAFATIEKNQAQCDLAKSSYRESLLNAEIAYLKSRLNDANAKRALPQNNAPRQFGEVVNLFMDKSMNICQNGGCRVFDAECSRDLLHVSMKSPNSLFNGYGLKTISISAYKPLAFIPVHSHQIRDVCIHPENSWVLTASMDKSFKVVDNVTNAITHRFLHQMPLWSCCWDANNSHILYVGTQSGVVVKYDIRRLTEAVCTLAIEGDMSPVVSVASIPTEAGQPLPQGGVVSCKLNSLWAFENNSEAEHIRHPLSLSGPFVSMKYQNSTKQLLVSSRPNSTTSYSRHILCTLERKDERVNCNVIYSFQGGGMQKLLSKSCFVSNVNDYVAAYQENTRKVFLWSLNTGEKVGAINAFETVLDLKGIRNNNGNYLVSLTEKRLEFFKFN